MTEPVEVVELDGVEVDDRDMPDTGAGERLADGDADAAGADDPDVLAGNVCLHLWTPGGDGADHPFVRPGRRREVGIVIDGEALAEAADVVGVKPLVGSRGSAAPLAGAPGLVPCERQAGGGVVGECEVVCCMWMVGLDVVAARAVRAGGERTAVCTRE